MGTDGVQPDLPDPPAPAQSDSLDADSRRWLQDLGSSGHAHDDAVRRLHDLLLRAARFAVSRRRRTATYLRGGDHDESVSAHQREVLVAVTLNAIPIDVLAGRLNTTRGALYKTLHDARKKLRHELTAQGLDISSMNERTRQHER